MNTLLKGLLAEPDIYADFNYLAYWSKTFQNTAGMSLFAAWIKIFKFISFNKTMSQLSGTITQVCTLKISLYTWHVCKKIMQESLCISYWVGVNLFQFENFPQDYQVDLYLRQLWFDPRLNHTKITQVSQYKKKLLNGRIFFLKWAWGLFWSPEYLAQTQTFGNKNGEWQ